MSVALAAPAPPNPGEMPRLWGDMEIEIVGGTGEFSSGKTLFGLSIDPGPRTLVYDFEGSATSYKGIGFKHVDCARELLQRYPNGFNSLQRFEWWLAHARAELATGKYTVMMVDPISELEAGIADYVKKKPEQFGFTKNQFDRSAGLFWGCVKDYEKQILDEFRARNIQTFYFVTHMRNEFRGNSPTGKREAKGKETLFELASLYLKFERDLTPQGTRPEVPGAVVLKSRLARTGFVEGKLKTVAILPPRIPVATPDAIREYIAKPANYENLSEAERVHEKQMSEQEKLAIQAQIASDQRAAAEAEASRIERLHAAATAQSAAVAAQPPAPDQSAQLAQAAEQKAQEQARQAMIDALAPEGEPYANDGTIEDAQRTYLRQLLEKAGIPGDVFVTAIKEHYDVDSAMQLSKNNASLLIKALHVKLGIAPGSENQASNGQASNGQASNGQASNGQASTPVNQQPSAPPPPATKPKPSDYAQAAKAPAAEHQIAQIKNLAAQAQLQPADLKAKLAEVGCEKLSDLKFDQAEKLIGMLSVNGMGKRLSGEIPAEANGDDEIPF